MSAENQLIFISIASYRDIQLVPTVEDLVAKADEPGLLRFGICWQHGADEPPLPFAEDPIVKLIDVPWQQSRGACWARAEAMKLWSGEQWFLQVDSHCRFVEGWDTRLVRMMAQTGSPKPILSTYANGFTPAEPGSEAREALEGSPQLIAIGGFALDGLPKLKPLDIRDYATRSRPMAARFLAGGFLFAPGSFVKDVPYDPELYFFGEEISMTLRAYTSGYDLFHPVERIAWHDYIRAYATRHWDDHGPVVSEKTSASSAWRDLDGRSRTKVSSLLIGNESEDLSGSESRDSAAFGRGTVRTLKEYEAYAGLSFALRKMHDYTRRALEPPSPPAPEDWPDRIYTWMVRILFDREALSPCAFDPSGFWLISIQDEELTEIDRHDCTREELESVSTTEPKVLLIREFQAGIIPAFWSVQPFSRDRGWGRKITGRFAESDYAIVSDEPEENV